MLAAHKCDLDMQYHAAITYQDFESYSYTLQDPAINERVHLYNF